MSPVLLNATGCGRAKSRAGHGDPDAGPSARRSGSARTPRRRAHRRDSDGTVGAHPRAGPRCRLDGELITVQMFRTNLGVMRGPRVQHEIAYTVDGQEVHRFRMGAKPISRRTCQHDQARRSVDERGRVRLRLSAGPHVDVRRPSSRQCGGESDAAAPFVRSSTDTVTPRAIHTSISSPDRSVQPQRPAPRRSARGVFTCHRRGRGRRSVREEDHRDPGAPAYRGDSDRRRCASPPRLLPGRPPRRQLRALASRRPSAHPLASRKFRLSPRARSAGVAPARCT